MIILDIFWQIKLFQIEAKIKLRCFLDHFRIIYRAKETLR